MHQDLRICLRRLRGCRLRPVGRLRCFRRLRCFGRLRCFNRSWCLVRCRCRFLDRFGSFRDRDLRFLDDRLLCERLLCGRFLCGRFLISRLDVLLCRTEGSRTIAAGSCGAMTACGCGAVDS
jgi:hypothetical protein